MVFSLCFVNVCFVNFNKGNFVFVNFDLGMSKGVHIVFALVVNFLGIDYNQTIFNVLVYLRFYILLGKF